MQRSDLGKSQPENVQGPTSKSQRSVAEKTVQQILTILHKWGIHSIGQLAALDKEQLGARLGPEAVRLWERANGSAIRLLKFVRPPESFQESFEFESEIETAEPLLFMLRRFLEQLAVRLNAIYLVAKELTLRITFANSHQDEPAVTGKQSYERVFKIPQPTNDVDLLFRMLQTHLENFRSEHPIVAVTLSAEPIKPAGEQFGLFETTLRNPHQLSETVARLTALLGAERVGTPILEQTHRPDAFRMQPFCSTGLQSATGRICRGEPVGRAGVLGCKRNGRLAAASPSSGGQDAGLPHSQDGCAPLSPTLRRFRSGVSAYVLWDENKPAHLRSSQIRGKITEQRGPYFLSGNWWDEKSWGRAEWDLQLQNGELLLAYESEGAWKIDGLYD
jgi:protein ImuB